MYDVLVAGCGPVGAVLAARLAAHRLSVLVVEPRRDVVPFPRAVAADDEVQHLLDATAPGVVGQMLTDQRVRFLGARRQLVGAVDFPRSPCGYSGLAFFRQPALEAQLRTQLLRLDGVELRLGRALEGWAQDRTGVTARLDDGTVVRTSWLVGADGASSFVRSSAGIGWVGRDLPSRWLVVDADGAVAGRTVFTYTADPQRPQVDMPLPGGHRWEWLLGRDEPAPDPLPLLRRDCGPDQVNLVRAAVYSFAARRAQTWRTGRVLLAGDAAHTMPPFAGQGVGAGIRDAWVLGELLGGRPTDPRELDAYQAQRAPHVAAMTRLSLLLGTVLTVRSRPAATARDVALRAAFAAPGLGGWLRSGGPRSPASGIALPRVG